MRRKKGWSQVNLYVGAQIRRYRKNRQMTLQQLADRIHKSRASVSKYGDRRGFSGYCHADRDCQSSGGTAGAAG